MKRLYVSIVIMIAMITLSSVILFDLYKTKNEIIYMLDEIKTDTANQNYQAAYEKAEYFNLFWDTEEARLIRYVRHSQLDIITYSSAKLPALLKYGEYGECISELDQIKMALEHLWKSELPTINNIF